MKIRIRPIKVNPILKIYEFNLFNSILLNLFNILNISQDNI